MTNTSHLAAIQERLGREQQRLAEATTPRERDFRAMLVTQAQREMEAEFQFLGMTPTAALPALSADDLLAALLA